MCRRRKWHIRVAYDAWGNPISKGADPLYTQNPFRYRGYYYDEETGFYFLQTRYYDPEVKRFISADCLFVAGDELTGANMYAYCNGNPVMYCDPSGMGPEAEGIALAFILGAFGALLSALTPEILAPIVSGITGLIGSIDLAALGNIFTVIAKLVEGLFGLDNYYDTADLAAEAFGRMYNGRSIAEDREYAAFIYTKTIAGKTYYKYSTPIPGTHASFSLSLASRPRNTVSIVHTHGKACSCHDKEVFSSDDFDAWYGIQYLITPSGTLRKYNPGNINPDSRDGAWIIATGLPC